MLEDILREEPEATMLNKIMSDNNICIVVSDKCDIEKLRLIISSIYQYRMVCSRRIYVYFLYESKVALAIKLLIRKLRLNSSVEFVNVEEKGKVLSGLLGSDMVIYPDRDEQMEQIASHFKLSKFVICSDNSFKVKNYTINSDKLCDALCVAFMTCREVCLGVSEIL